MGSVWFDAGSVRFRSLEINPRKVLPLPDARLGTQIGDRVRFPTPGYGSIR